MFKNIGKTHVAKLVKPPGGYLGGRNVPKEKLNNNTWTKLLRLEKPPADGLFITRKSVADPKYVVEQAKDARKHMPINQLWKLVSVAIKNQPSGNKKTAKLPKSIPTDVPPKVEDWNSISPDTEADMLGIEQLNKGDTIAIVGAGISGLTLAWLLNRARPDLKIHIFDKSERVGGWMKSDYDGNIFESGPRTLMPSHVGTKVLLEILNSIGKLDQVIGVPKASPANTKGLVYDGKVIQLPRGALSSLAFFLTSPIFKGLRLSTLSETWRAIRDPKVNDESVADFIGRRFDPKMDERVFSALMRGIYGASSSELSARSVARFKQMYYLERVEKMGITVGALTGSLSYLSDYEKRAIPMLAQSLIIPERRGNDENILPVDCSKFSLFGFRHGIESMAEAIASDLKRRRGVKFHLGAAVKQLQYDGQKVTVDCGDGEAVTADMVSVTVADPSIFSGDLEKLLGQIEYTNLAVVNVSTPEPIAKDWFGVLVPKSEDKTNKNSILGIIFDSSVRNAAEPVTSEGEPVEKATGSNLTLMIGGDLWTDMTADQAVEKALAGIEQYLGPFDRSKVRARATLQKKCIPKYQVGYSALVDAIHREASKEFRGRLTLSGMALGRGVGVSDNVLDSLFLATRFTEQRKLLHPEFFFGEIWSNTRPEWYA